MDRKGAFDSFFTHPMLGRICKKLKANELAIVDAFLNENNDLPKDKFEIKINRMFLDKPKPKHWKEISELLTCANSALP